MAVTESRGDCSEIRSLLSAYADGEVGEADEIRLRGHLAGCTSCTSHLAFVRALNVSLRGAPLESPSPALFERIASATYAAPVRPTFRERIANLLAPPAIRLAFGSAIAAGIVAAVVIPHGDSHLPVSTVASQPTTNPAVVAPNTHVASKTPNTASSEASVDATMNRRRTAAEQASAAVNVAGSLAGKTPVTASRSSVASMSPKNARSVEPVRSVATTTTPARNTGAGSLRTTQSNPVVAQTATALKTPGSINPLLPRGISHTPTAATVVAASPVVASTPAPARPETGAVPANSTIEPKQPIAVATAPVETTQEPVRVASANTSFRLTGSGTSSRSGLSSTMTVSLPKDRSGSNDRMMALVTNPVN